MIPFFQPPLKFTRPPPPRSVVPSAPTRPSSEDVARKSKPKPVVDVRVATEKDKETAKKAKEQVRSRPSDPRDDRPTVVPQPSKLSKEKSRVPVPAPAPVRVVPVQKLKHNDRPVEVQPVSSDEELPTSNSRKMEFDAISDDEGPVERRKTTAREPELEEEERVVDSPMISEVPVIAESMDTDEVEEVDGRHSEREDVTIQVQELFLDEPDEPAREPIPVVIESRFAVFNGCL